MNIRQCQTFIGYSASYTGGKIYSQRRRKRRPGQRGGSVEYIDPNYLREMSPVVNKKGYHCLCIRHNGKLISITVHRLVMDAFEGAMPPGMEIRHLDNNPSNNDYINLCYGTSLENAADRLAAGTYLRGGKHKNAKLTDKQAAEIRQLRAKKMKVRDLACRFNVSVATIESIIYGKSYNVLSTTGKPDLNKHDGIGN